MRRIKIKGLWLLAALSIWSCFTVNVSARSLIRRLASDQFEIILEQSDSDSVKILQVTDLHLGSREHWQDDLNTFQRIKRLVKMHDPQFIFITGDLFTGEKPYGSLLAAYAVHFFDELERPWFYTFGNHDPEGGFGHDDIYNVFKTSEWGVLGFHKTGVSRKYDYFVNIRIGKKPVPIWQVYAFDTGPHDGTKAVQKDQIEWYKKISRESKQKYNQTVRAVAIFHIPLIEYKELWEDQRLKKKGVSLEEVCYEADDGSLYKAFLEAGNIRATFCGHDHYNNYWGKYSGDIILAYGYISGESTNEAWPTGGKLITLPVSESEISMKNVVPIFNENEHKY
jgi:3',5'-cyclic AMP phosphodiesterase CpdA